MSGVDNMLYMYSINANNGQMALRVDFDVATDPKHRPGSHPDALRSSAGPAASGSEQLRVTIRKSAGSPLLLFSLYSPNGTYDQTFIANYAYINIADPLARVKGVGQVQVFGAGQYAMRLWVKPDHLAKLGVSVSEITDAVSNQNTVNPSGQVGLEPVPAGQEFTYTLRAQGRLEAEEEFGSIVIRANPDGSFCASGTSHVSNSGRRTMPT